MLLPALHTLTAALLMAVRPEFGWLRAALVAARIALLGLLVNAACHAYMRNSFKRQWRQQQHGGQQQRQQQQEQQQQQVVMGSGGRWLGLRGSPGASGGVPDQRAGMRGVAVSEAFRKEKDA